VLEIVEIKSVATATETERECQISHHVIQWRYVVSVTSVVYHVMLPRPRLLRLVGYYYDDFKPLSTCINYIKRHLDTGAKHTSIREVEGDGHEANDTHVPTFFWVVLASQDDDNWYLAVWSGVKRGWCGNRQWGGKGVRGHSTRLIVDHAPMCAIYVQSVVSDVESFGIDSDDAMQHALYGKSVGRRYGKQFRRTYREKTVCTMSQPHASQRAAV
jgi:hypothetical protein